jgi:hypothetical protein
MFARLVGYIRGIAIGAESKPISKTSYGFTSTGRSRRTWPAAYLPSRRDEWRCAISVV